MIKPFLNLFVLMAGAILLGYNGCTFVPQYLLKGSRKKKVHPLIATSTECKDLWGKTIDLIFLFVNLFFFN